MVLKPRKQLKKQVIAGYVWCIVVQIFIGTLSFDESGIIGDTLKDKIGFACIWLGECILVFSIFTGAWISAGRTIIMSEKGCVVSFRNHQREYKWEEFKVKAVEDFSRTYWGLTAYEKAAIFSPRYIHKPWWWQPTTYGVYLHPFSFIYIYFTPEEKNSWNYTNYEVDEKEFMEKMREWGIELDEISFYDGMKWKKESKKNRVQEKRDKSS